MPKKTEVESGIAGRLRLIMSRMGLNQAKLAEMMDTSSAYVSNILKAGKQPGSTILSSFKKNLPEINLNWLITGDGEMFCNTQNNTPQTAETHHTPAPAPVCNSIDLTERLLTIVETCQSEKKQLFDTIDKLTSILQNSTQQQSTIPKVAPETIRLQKHK